MDVTPQYHLQLDDHHSGDSVKGCHLWFRKDQGASGHGLFYILPNFFFWERERRKP